MALLTAHKKYLSWLIPRLYLSSGNSTTPDPNAVASAQTAANENAAQYNAQLNRYNQYGPTGAVTWNESPSGNWSQNTTLSPQEQQLFNTQLNTQNNVANQANQFAGNQLATAVNTPIPGASNQDFSTVQNALYGQIQPWLQQNTNMQQTQLANQGIAPGTQAYNMAMLQNNQANNQAMLGVIGDTTGQMSQQQNMAINQQNQALNTYNQLNGGSGSVQAPSYTGQTSVAGVQPADIGSYIYNGYNANTGTKNAGLTGGLGALGSLGGAAIGNMG